MIDLAGVVVVSLAVSFVLQAIQFVRLGTPNFWRLQPFVWLTIGIALVGVLTLKLQP